MYELHHVMGSTYYIACRAKVGLVVHGDHEVYLIDSGHSERAGRKIKEILDEHQWTLTAIYITHSHADHIGGLSYLQKHTDCNVYAPPLECPFIQTPMFTSALAYGAYPIKELRHKAMMVDPCEAEALSQDTLPSGWSTVDLAGHCVQMVGYRTPDEVLFVGDAILNKHTLDNYGLLYLFNVRDQLDSLHRLLHEKAAMYVPAHTMPQANVEDLIRYNIAHIEKVLHIILSYAKEPILFEHLLQRMIAHFHIPLHMGDYLLISNALRAYMGYLKEEGKLDFTIHEDCITWQAT